VHLILALSVSPTGDWTEAGAIMTFAIPVGLFVVVTTWLYFLYTRPHAVPGHSDLVLTGAPGGHAAGVARPAAAQEPPRAQPPSAPQDPPAAPPPGGGGMPGPGDRGRPDGMEGRE
jgi:hypothetical protein